MSSAIHVAVLDDEVEITLLLAGYLQSHGYRVSQLHDGPALLRLMAADPPQLVLLDLGLPGEDGFSIARQLREHWGCGLVIVTGRGDAVDKVVGLEVGADDYVTKPFDLRELLARIKAVLRRSAGEPRAAPAPPVHRFAGWQLDVAARRLVDPAGREVALTTGEFDLLAACSSSTPARCCRATSCSSRRAAARPARSIARSTSRSAACARSSRRTSTSRRSSSRCAGPATSWSRR